MKEVIETKVIVDTYEQSKITYGYCKASNGHVVVVSSVKDQENLISIACLGGYITVKGEDLARAIQKCLM